MSTVIICPACRTRYEIAAVIPPGGRKARCSKCGHVWQATAVMEAAKPPVASAPQAPAMAPSPAPTQPRPAPTEPGPAPMAANAAMGGFPGSAQQPPNGSAPSGIPPSGAGANASFDAQDELQADFAGDGAASRAESWSDAQGAVSADASGQDLGSYNAGTLVNPADLAQANVAIAGEGGKRKLPPAVAIGWGVLVLLLLILAAMLALAPKTVVSAVPGAARLYAMLGAPVNLRGLAIRDVHYVWASGDGGPVLKVEGNIVNLTSSSAPVPPVVIALQDASGKEISVVTTNVATLAAGAGAPFAVEISSAPATVRSLEVRFAKAS